MHTAFDFICLVNRCAQHKFELECKRYNAMLQNAIKYQEEHAVEYEQYEKALGNLKEYIQKCVDTPGFVPAYIEYRKRHNLVSVLPDNIADFIVNLGAHLPAPEELAFVGAQSYLEYKKRYAEALQVYSFMPKAPARPRLPEFPMEPYIIQHVSDLAEALHALEPWEIFCNYAYDQYWSERELWCDQDAGKLFVRLHDLTIALTEED